MAAAYPQQYAPAPTPSRPLGVAILAVLIGIVGALFLIGALIFFVLSGYAYAHSLTFFGATTIGGIILLIVGIILLAVASGLWNLRMWALALAVIVLVFAVLVAALTGHIFSIGTLIEVVLLIYLVAVRSHFD